MWVIHVTDKMATDAPEIRPRRSSIDEMEELLDEADVLDLLPCGDSAELDPDDQALLSELAGGFGSTDTKETLRMALAMMRGQPRGCGAGGVMACGTGGVTAAPSLCKCSSAAVLCRCPVPMSVAEPKLSSPPDSLNGTPEPAPSSPTSPADTPAPAPASGASSLNILKSSSSGPASEKSSTLARVGAKALDYSRFMDGHGLGVALMDMQGNFLWTNSTTQGLLGYSGKQLESLSIMHVTPAADLPGMMVMMPRLVEPGSQPTISSPMVSKPRWQPLLVLFSRALACAVGSPHSTLCHLPSFPHLKHSFLSFWSDSSCRSASSHGLGMILPYPFV